MSAGRQVLIAASLTGSAVLAGALTWLQVDIGPRGAGYAAKVLCSAVYNSDRDAASVQAEELSWLWYVQSELHPEDKRASASLYGLGRSVAVWREGLGCTLVRGTDADTLQAERLPVPPAPPHPPAIWPDGDQMEPAPRYAAVQQVLDAALVEPNPDNPRRTRGLVVIHDGALVGEAYAAGWTAQTRHTGWSMSKSVTSTFVGMAVQRGLVTLGAPEVPEWGEDDPRKAITLQHMLRMTDGLAFREEYGAFGEATDMLYRQADMAAFTASRGLLEQPGTRWYYSSGTTNLISRSLRVALGDAQYHAAPRQWLFGPLGMASALWEPDASGTFVGSSYVWATPRDWARLGQLMLQDGMWNGKRLLPAGWVASATTPSEPSAGLYGYQWWLNQGQPDSDERRYPDLPPGAFDASGYEGQNVLVVPSAKLVLVRVGQTRDRSTFRLNDLARDVVAALPEPEPAEEAPAEDAPAEDAPAEDPGLTPGVSP